MQIVTCKAGHSIEIKLKPNLQADFPSQGLFSQGNIEIFIGRVKDNELKLAIMVPRQFMVVHNQ